MKLAKRKNKKNLVKSIRILLLQSISAYFWREICLLFIPLPKKYSHLVNECAIFIVHLKVFLTTNKKTKYPFLNLKKTLNLQVVFLRLKILNKIKK